MSLTLCTWLLDRLAILGLTEQYILQRVDPSQYTKWRLELGDYVVQHNALEEPEDNIVRMVPVGEGNM